MRFSPETRFDSHNTDPYPDAKMTPGRHPALATRRRPTVNKPFRNHRHHCLFRTTVLPCLLLVLSAGQTIAQKNPDPPLLSASDIDTRMRMRNSGFHSLYTQIHMEITTPDKETATRELRMWIQEDRDNETAVLCVVDSPADLRQTALLSQKTAGAESRQWLYLPAAQRVRRLAGGTRGGAFLGSDFSYADLTGAGIEGSEPNFSGTAMVGDDACYLLVYTAPGKDAVYGKQTVWICKNDFIMRRIDYEDARGRPLKTLWLEYHGDPEAIRHGHARNLRMQNHRNGGQTLVAWRDVQYGVALDDRLFDPRMLSESRFR
ncbi:MAG: outer membrane lipoprotein-sorting protein [Kiritimatiellia bacterium]